MIRLLSHTWLLLSLFMAPVAVFALDVDEGNGERRQFLEQALLGQVDYLSSQGNYYEALQLISGNDLLGEREIRQRLKQRKQDLGNGRKTLAEIEIAYRMNQRAGNAVREVLDADVDQRVRNQAAYDLAMIYYRKSQYDYARFALQLIRGDLYYPLEHDVAYLVAMLDARSGKVEQAIHSLDQLKGDKRTHGFARFNLAHLQLQQGLEQSGIANLDEIGQLKSEDMAVQALSDKANLVLGYRYLARDDAANTLKYLSRVRLDGAFTGKALLGLAWTHMKAEDYRAAVVPWTHLSQRVPVDTAVLEATIALPYVYGKLGVHGKASKLYSEAVETLSQYQAWLKSAATEVQDTGVISSVMYQDDAAPAEASGLLVDLLASRQYQQSAHNYRDLSQMIALLEQRKHALDVTSNMLEQRYTSFEADLVALDASLVDIDKQLSQARQRRDQLDDEIRVLGGELREQAAMFKPESRLLASLEPVAIESTDSSYTELAQMGVDLQAIQGARDEVHDLIESVVKRRDSIMRHRDELTSYEEFMLPVSDLSERTGRLLSSMRDALEQQRLLLKQMTSTAVSQRLALVESYIATARYELAKTYDVLADKERLEPGKVLELRTGDVISP